jgi:hypothetical protein
MAVQLGRSPDFPVSLLLRSLPVEPGAATHLEQPRKVFGYGDALCFSVCDWPWQQQKASRKMGGLGVGFRHSQYAFCRDAIRFLSKRKTTL